MQAANIKKVEIRLKITADFSIFMRLFSRDFALYRTEYADENKITSSASKGADRPIYF